MSNSYSAVSAPIFAVVALAHLARIINRWTVQIGPYKVSMNVSCAALVVSALLTILGLYAITAVAAARRNAPGARHLTFFLCGWTAQR
jgi:hypothetical protein